MALKLVNRKYNFKGFSVKKFVATMEKQKPLFDPAELALLKEGLERSYKERFEMCTRLYKIQQTMSKATIVHKKFIF